MGMEIKLSFMKLPDFLHVCPSPAPGHIIRLLFLVPVPTGREAHG